MYEITVTARNNKLDAPVASIVTALYETIRPWTPGGWSKSIIFTNIITAHSEAQMDADILVKVMNSLDYGIPNSDLKQYVDAILPICTQHKVSCHVVIVGVMMREQTIQVPKEDAS